MIKLNFVHGDITEAKPNGPQIFAHFCNDVGLWSGSVAESIAKRWPEAEREYLRWYRERSHSEFGPGAVQFVKAFCQGHDIRIANMISRHGAQLNRGKARPVRYRRIARCLSAVTRKALAIGASVHLPDLVGNRRRVDRFDDDRFDIETLIRSTLCACGVAVYMYCPVPVKEERKFRGYFQPTRRVRLFDGGVTA